MLRPLVYVASGLTSRRPHHERARRNNNHLRTILGALPESVARFERALLRGRKHMTVDLREPIIVLFDREALPSDRDTDNDGSERDHRNA